MIELKQQKVKMEMEENKDKQEQMRKIKSGEGLNDSKKGEPASLDGMTLSESLEVVKELTPEQSSLFLGLCVFVDYVKKLPPAERRREILAFVKLLPKQVNESEIFVKE